MRNVTLQIDTFAAVWADRQTGEDSEDAIIRRRFGLGHSASPATRTEAPSPRAALAAGLFDARNGVEFAEGFEIFRTYKGTEYRAKACAGHWLLMNTGDLHPTLNALSQAIGAHEDAWHGWRFRDANSREQFINQMRDQQKVGKRRLRPI